VHLENRIGEPLEAPKDWARPAKISCECQYSSELSSFLANPSEECWTLRARQDIRDRIENIIRRAKADLDLETLRRGSPHSLICTKNDASYQRRVAQRNQDLADLAILQQ
ncbi:MAG: 2OG-Fe(II) oxygenase, partial [Pseudomonadota bacterium]